MIRIPVLMYHHIAPDREVTPVQFENHLAYLKRSGYRTPRLDEFQDLITGRRKTGGKPVLITFDDGYADNWICAWPLLKKYGFTAVVFPVTSRLGEEGTPRPTLADGAPAPQTREGERETPGFLTWSELKAMLDSGVFEAGSHTHTHKNFDKRAEYADLAMELETSGRLIRERTGVAPISIAWPWGRHERKWEPLLLQSGYELAFTTITGINKPGADPLYLKRIKVTCGSAGWLKSRLMLHTLPGLSGLYSRLYGLDSKLKAKVRGRLKKR